jgi:hypothetical protein
VAVGRSWQFDKPVESSPQRVATHLWIVAAVAAAMWIAALPVTQREQRLRSQAESDLRGGRIAQALQLMSAHERSDFPPHWDPPPRLGYREPVPDLLEVLQEVVASPVSDWVRETYVEKFSNALRGEDSYAGVWRSLDEEQLALRLDLLERLPEGEQIVRDHQEPLKNRAQYEMSTPLRARVEKLLSEAGVAVDAGQSPQ